MQDHTQGTHLAREVLRHHEKRRPFLGGHIEPVAFPIMKAHAGRAGGFCF
jgi:hypothetical protein